MRTSHNRICIWLSNSSCMCFVSYAATCIPQLKEDCTICKGSLRCGCTVSIEYLPVTQTTRRVDLGVCAGDMASYCSATLAYYTEPAEEVQPQAYDAVCGLMALLELTCNALYHESDRPQGPQQVPGQFCISCDYLKLRLYLTHRVC